MSLMWLFISIGGFVGGYIPVLLGQNDLSAWAILGAAVGSLAGLWLFKKMDV